MIAICVQTSEALTCASLRHLAIGCFAISIVSLLVFCWFWLNVAIKR